jgi:threonyl-tRNA synthetase
MESNNNEIYKIRHSLAHVLAQAVLEMRPKAQLAFGPPIDTGCYYDFLLEEPLTPEHFKEIEKKIRKIISQGQEFSTYSLTVEEACKYLESTGQEFKVEYCKELGQGGEQQISFYKNGSFVDMCAGPHVANTSKIPLDSFAVDSLAGAYWRGNENNPQLTRIYCLAFATKNELEEFISNRKLAQERDHRKLGKELELFLLSDKVGVGLPLWTPAGTAVKDAIESLVRETEQKAGYHRVCTPHIAKEEIYHTSGHLPYYADSMFPPMELEGESKYYLKAMNCPHHHMIYAQRPRSYKELPLRLAEYGTCYRYESSGSLAGLLRVRSLCINDGHIYCTPEQLKEELIATFKLTLDFYNFFRFKNITVRLSTHDPKNKDKFVDNPQMWKYSEDIVEQVAQEMKVEYHLGVGEAAFYGPKIDFQASTMLGRTETLGTTQLDFSSPLRFDLNYIASDGSEKKVYIVHRAPLSSHERFMAFLIEHFGGAFPTWLAPVQVKVIPVNERNQAYCKELLSTLNSKLVRVECDESSNSFNKKIREAVTQKIPNILIVGDKEQENGTVTLRRYHVKEQVTMPKESFISQLLECISLRKMDTYEPVKYQE